MQQVLDDFAKYYQNLEEQREDVDGGGEAQDLGRADAPQKQPVLSNCFDEPAAECAALKPCAFVVLRFSSLAFVRTTALFRHLFVRSIHQARLNLAPARPALPSPYKS